MPDYGVVVDIRLVKVSPLEQPPTQTMANGILTIKCTDQNTGIKLFSMIAGELQRIQQTIDKEREGHADRNELRDDGSGDTGGSTGSAEDGPGRPDGHDSVEDGTGDGPAGPSGDGSGG